MRQLRGRASVQLAEVMDCRVVFSNCLARSGCLWRKENGWWVYKDGRSGVFRCGSEMYSEDMVEYLVRML